MVGCLTTEHKDVFLKLSLASLARESTERPCTRLEGRLHPSLGEQRFGEAVAARCRIEYLEAVSGQVQLDAKVIHS